jgi:CHAT domain-containing protein
MRVGRYDAADALFREALGICLATLGNAHPRCAELLRRLGIARFHSGNTAESLRLMMEAIAIDDETIDQILPIASDRQRLAFLEKINQGVHALLSLVVQCFRNDPGVIRSAFELVQRRKALAAEILAVRRDSVLSGQYPELAPLLRETTELRMRIARLRLNGPRAMRAAAFHALSAKWHTQLERLEADLASQVPELKMGRKLRGIETRSLSRHLPEGTDLIEYARIIEYDFSRHLAQGKSPWKSARYVAFVLRSGGTDDVHLVDLGEAGPIDDLIADFRAEILGDPECRSLRDVIKVGGGLLVASPQHAGSSLRAAVFDVLVPALGGRKQLLLAPDGDLSRLPFEVLPRGDGSRLIDDHQISYLSCGRDLLRLGPATSGHPDSPMVLADPDFDLGTADGSLVTPVLPGRTRAGLWSRILRPKETGSIATLAEASAPESAPAAPEGLSPTLNYPAYSFERLPGTRVEGETVAGLLGVEAKLDADALKGRLKACCRSPQVLHLASHGYFLPDLPGDLGRNGVGWLSDSAGSQSRLVGPLLMNPMLRSGMVLAGANTWLKSGNPPEEAEDGLLTAADVTGLDLLATELVVLSACETGLGQVHVGEGVFGLRRAFVLAGAKTLVMSLWKVPDEPTQELMENFYGRLLAGQGRAEALRQAQLAMKEKYPDPFYWGAFICQGDPSPLGPVGPGGAGTGVATDRPIGCAASSDSG